jgi:GNAT superfamily N-acetyltransferase
VTENEPIVLRDGTQLQVDPLSPEDRDELREGIEHLSPDSRYRRFFTPTTHVSTQQLTYLTTIDHRRHEALAAVDPDTGRGIAVARYVLAEDAPGTAEVALAVLDEWQGKGVGRTLLHRLAAVALRRGIVRFTGLMLGGNGPMISLMRSLGRVVSTHRDSGTVELVVEIDSDSVR